MAAPGSAAGASRKKTASGRVKLDLNDGPILYLMELRDTMKVGISHFPEQRRQNLQAKRIVKTWHIGHDARIVEAVVCKMLAQRFEQHLAEAFSCTERQACRAIEAARVAVYRMDFSMFHRGIGVPKKAKDRWLHLHRPRRMNCQEDEHVRAWVHYRASLSADEAKRLLKRK